MDNKEPVSIGEWILVKLLLSIPFINVISIIIMAFFGMKQSMKNYAVATLIIWGCVILFIAILGFTGVLAFS